MPAASELQGDSRVRALFASSRTRKIVNALGVLLTVGSLFYVGHMATLSYGELGETFTSRYVLPVLAVAIVAYALLTLLIGIAFYVLLGAADRGTLTLFQALVIFGRSQIWKYLPTNVLHFVGRYALMRERGIGNKVLAWATFAEIVLMAAAAAGIALTCALPVVRQWIDVDWVRQLLPVAAIGFAACVIIGAVLLLRWKMPSHKAAAARLMRGAVSALALYGVFFIVNGLMFGGLLVATTGHPVVPGPLLVGLFAAAWFAGFVVPGAPAGIGIREAVLTSGLHLLGAGAVAAPAAIAYRIVTLGGDVLVAVTSTVVARLADEATESIPG